MAEKSACQGLVQGEIFLGGQGKMIPASNLGVRGGELGGG
jgi:hypothetical protein